MIKYNYYKLSKSKKIRYLKHSQKNNIYIVFLHGFMSDLEGQKPKHFLKFAIKKKIGFLALEYSGHGKSSGKFTKGNISKWSKETSLLIKNVVKENDFILIGSSMGAWISLKQFNIFKKQIKGFSVTSGSAWEDKMDSFPSVNMGYIKTTDHSSPIRIESLISSKSIQKDYEYILATARLLPNYGFPVGLNVVDKFAKIPNWMSKASRRYYATHLLKQAVKSKDQNTISLAVKILSKKVRSWRNRPLGGMAR